jgi:elongation factor P hydroxylase
VSIALDIAVDRERELHRRIVFERDLYKQALEEIAKWPAAGRAQETAKLALKFAADSNTGSERDS